MTDPTALPRHIYGIIGSPVSHSLSPLLHNTGFRRIGHPGVYFAWEIPTGVTARFFMAVHTLGIDGASVTIPHKEAALALADDATERARRIGAANTLIRQDDRILADNTDVDGFLLPLRNVPLGPGSTVLLLGAGGAARAVAVGLQERNVGTVVITSRSGEPAPRLAEEFGFTACPWQDRGDVVPDLIVNTTPLGMTGAGVADTPYPADFMAGRQAIVYDTVYTPLRTRLIREAAAAGLATITGLDMFLGQG
ncbi:MAG: shikimate dehydrogenase, partial [Planctomycetes bacterium]|nr:shikimate dehydrogenase [Planctomycetota bacterium]